MKPALRAAHQLASNLLSGRVSPPWGSDQDPGHWLVSCGDLHFRFRPRWLSRESDGDTAVEARAELTTPGGVVCSPWNYLDVPFRLSNLKGMLLDLDIALRRQAYGGGYDVAEHILAAQCPVMTLPKSSEPEPRTVILGDTP